MLDKFSPSSTPEYRYIYPGVGRALILPPLGYVQELASTRNGVTIDHLTSPSQRPALNIMCGTISSAMIIVLCVQKAAITDDCTNAEKWFPW